jgi:DNA-binding response OmpR family regulator
LVVDDDLALRELFARVLRKNGFEVEIAGDDVAAIRAFERRAFGVVVTDIIMPEKEGVETLVEIKRRWPASKIVAVSGCGSVGFDGYLAIAASLGADATLRKPVESQQLVRVIKDLLGPSAGPARSDHAA